MKRIGTTRSGGMGAGSVRRNNHSLIFYELHQKVGTWVSLHRTSQLSTMLAVLNFNAQQLIAF